MTIAFDAKRALNNATGLGNHARILVNALIKYFPGNEYLLFSPQASDDFLDQLRGDFKIYLPTGSFQKKFHPLWRSFGITNRLLSEQVDIYHGLSNELPFNIHSTRIQTVVTIHDLIFLKHKEQYPFFDRRIYEGKTRYAAKHAKKIIAVSNETKRDLMQLYGTPEDKIEVIYPSVDPQFETGMTGGSREILRKYNLPDKYILNVGSFFPRKNQNTLVEAFDLIKDKIEDNLILVGSQGYLKTEIEKLIQLKKLNGRVKILSQVPSNDLPAIYHAAGVFVFPSLYEGFGAPVLEALFSKVPVITTKNGCFEEAGGKDSLYINPLNAEEMADALLKVLNDGTLKNKMIENGYTHALTFSNKNFAEKTMAVYRELYH